MTGPTFRRGVFFDIFVEPLKKNFHRTTNNKVSVRLVKKKYIYSKEPTKKCNEDKKVYDKPGRATYLHTFEFHWLSIRFVKRSDEC